MKKVLMSLAAVSALAAALPAQAQFQRPEDAVKYRQSSLFVMAQHFGRIGGMAQGRIPFDAAQAAANADVVASLSSLPWAGFGAGHNVGTTRAKPEIWTDTARFNQMANDMRQATLALQTATKAPGLTVEQLRTAVGATSRTCQACHDAFRTPQ